MEINLETELNAKASDAITRVIEERQSGIVSHNEARIAVRAIFESVMGLVETGLSDVISAAVNEFEKPAKDVFPLHLKTANGAFLYVTIDTHNNCVRIKVLGTDTLQEYQEESARATVAKAIAVVKSLISRGAIKI
ncbi:TPA: hypothetical protein ACJI3N_005247 [Raoultella planticola]